MFDKLLIANRGEVARRIIKTCRHLGIKTVAIYSEVDAQALHVLEADEAYCIGPAPSPQSYLNSAEIIKVCRQAHVDAVHPGFGFLAENADFAQAVIDNNMTFIGPSPDLIRLMGDKLSAKKTAAASGLPLIPGLATPLDSADDAARFAAQHNYPILLKAAAGGGGKGMRIVKNADDLKEAFARCQSEAKSSFGDARVFVEKYIDNPRHIEVQVLSDNHGNVVHLGERDCSIQRRYQKIIEESPCAFISENLRNKITAAAVKLAQDVGYQSVGTVEFVVTDKEEFYFLEMNTRLQVEHPVTEACYNIDLVEQMIKVAAGHPLSLEQSTLQPKGHAIEVRLYAEDSDQDFLPSAGKLIQFIPPLTPAYRLDSGVTEGDWVSVYYDPMLAKIICHAPTRLQAIAVLQDCLSTFIIEGVATNINFLNRLIHHPDFIKGKFGTHFIEKHYQSLTKTNSSLFSLEGKYQLHIAAIACAIAYERQPGLLVNDIVVTCEGKALPAFCHNTKTFRIADELIEVSLDWQHQHQVFETIVNNCVIRGQCRYLNTGFDLTIHGQRFNLDVMPASTWPLLKHFTKLAKKNLFSALHSPMPGVLISLPLQVGDRVKTGQPLAVIEAMKMENTLKAPAEGTVIEILVQNGDTLQRNQVIAKFG